MDTEDRELVSDAEVAEFRCRTWWLRFVVPRLVAEGGERGGEVVAGVGDVAVTGGEGCLPDGEGALV